MSTESMTMPAAAPAAMQFQRIPDYEREELPVLDWGHEVKERELEWLWPGRIPLGKITLLAGDPEAGKSFVVADLAARTTRGGPWPDGVGPDGNPPDKPAAEL